MFKALPLLALCAFYASAQTLTITTDSLPPGVQYEPYEAALTASGGAPPYTWSFNRAASPAFLDGLLLDPSTGQISGTPTKSVCCSVTLTLTDSRGAQATRSAYFNIAPLLRVGQSLPVGPCPQQCLGSAGPATPPGACDVMAGTLPPGVSWSYNPDSQYCELRGTPTATGSFPVTLNTSGRAPAQLFLQVRMNAAGPPPGVIGTLYDQTIAPRGGSPPYQFSIAAGSLPAGLSLDAASGRITGTPAKYEYAPFALQITDSAQDTTIVPMGINIDLPALQPSDFTINIPSNAAAGQTVPVSVSLNKPLPVETISAVFGQFYPDPTMNVNDPTVGLSEQPIAVFQLPPNATSGPAALTLNTGTTAGDIVIGSLLGAGALRELTPIQMPYRVIHIGKAAPVIQSLTVAGSATGINLTITGFSTSRDLTQADVTLTPAPGVTLAGNTLTVSLASGASAWYGNSQSLQYGTQFGLTIPVALADGARDVTSVSVTLTNSSGTSAPKTATVTQ